MSCRKLSTPPGPRKRLSSKHTPLATVERVNILLEIPVRDRANYRQKWFFASCVLSFAYSGSKQHISWEAGIFTDEFTTLEHLTKVCLFPSKLTLVAGSHGSLA